MRELSPDFRKVTDEDKQPYNVDFKYGTYLSTMLIPCRKFLPWALEK